MRTLADAIAALRPKAHFAMRDPSDYATLDWHDETQAAPTQAEAEAALADLLAAAPPRLIRKSVIVSRLNDAGKLEAASLALNSNLYARERWYAPDQPSVYADNLEVIALLEAIGADVAAILAPE